MIWKFSKTTDKKTEQWIKFLSHNVPNIWFQQIDRSQREINNKISAAFNCPFVKVK